MLTLYGLKNCQTCQKACRWLERFAIPYRFIDYRAQPISAEQLNAWAQHVGDFKSLINLASPTWRQLPGSRRSPGTSAEWIVLLRDYPTLIRRPLVISQDGHYLGQGFSQREFERRFRTAVSHDSP